MTGPAFPVFVPRFLFLAIHNEGDVCMVRNIVLRDKLNFRTYIYAVVLISTMMLLQFKIVDAFFLLQVFGTSVIILRNGKISLSRDRRVNAVFLFWILSTVLCVLSRDIPLSYQKGSIIAMVQVVPLYFTFVYIERYTQRNQSLFDGIRKVILLSCVIELVWCLLQYVAYKLMGLDINRLIFTDMLHLVSSASQYKNGVFHPSGLCWHSAFIAPVAVIAFLFSKSTVIRLLAVLDVVICNNATALMAICLCIGLSFLSYLPRLFKSSRVRAVSLLLLCMEAAVILPAAVRMGFLETVWEKLLYIYQRSTGAVYDGGSAFAHIRYYTGYLTVLENSTPLQVLFGYGMGCSGLPISRCFGQYAELKNWAVETDVMNQIYSCGLIGFLVFYGFLLYITVHGWRLDRRYGILMLSLLCAGITYNIQFGWVILLELVLYLAVKRGYNLFESAPADTLAAAGFRGR